ncbi:MAG: MFS transporter [Candidatus Thorarchaeota archaeon]
MVNVEMWGQIVKTETIQFMAGAAVLSAFTYIPILARDHLGADEFYVTLLVGTYAASSFFSSYIFGRAGDIYGRRIVLRLGLLLAGITFALLWFATDPFLLFIIRISNGFSVGIYPGALAAYAHDSKMKMGHFATFGSLGWGIGTIIAGFAAGFNIHYAFAVSSLFFMLAFGSALTLPKVHRVKVPVPLFPVETLKRNAAIYAAVFIRHSSAFAIWTLWPLFLADLGGDLMMIGIVQAANSVSQVVFMATITDRMACRKLVTIGLIGSAITFFWFTLATNILEIIPSQILLGASWAFLYVGALKYVTERNIEKSTASGLLSSVLSIAGVFGPIYATILYALWPDYHPIMYFAVIMSLLAFVIFRVASNGEETPSTLSNTEDDFRSGA